MKFYPLVIVVEEIIEIPQIYFVFAWQPTMILFKMMVIVLNAQLNALIHVRGSIMAA